MKKCENTQRHMGITDVTVVPTATVSYVSYFAQVSTYSSSGLDI